MDAEALREVTSSWIQIKNLAKLQAKISEIATVIAGDYKICFELIITSGLTDSAKSDLAAFQAELAESETLSANLVLVGAICAKEDPLSIMTSISARSERGRHNFFTKN